MQSISTLDQVLDLLGAHGGAAYFGEPVTVLEHSLQAAALIQRKGGPPTLVAAGLLHDLGHLLHHLGQDAADRGLDTRHEELAAAALGPHLPAAVLDPIRLHVAAKRYLCFAHPDYLAQLSPASLTSLNLQGGSMTPEEAASFLQLPHARAALVLRHADDEAKIPALDVPPLPHYRPLLASLWN